MDSNHHYALKNLARLGVGVTLRDYVYLGICVSWLGGWDSNPKYRSSARPSLAVTALATPNLATPTGIEPVVSCVTGKRLKPLDYGAV